MVGFLRDRPSIRFVLAFAVLLPVRASAGVLDAGAQPVGPAGWTTSPGFPTTVAAFGTIFGGGQSGSVAAPLVGGDQLLLGKDKIGGNVQLFWSQGTPPFNVRRGGPFGNPSTIATVSTMNYDDPVLFDGLNYWYLID